MSMACITASGMQYLVLLHPYCDDHLLLAGTEDWHLHFCTLQGGLAWFHLKVLEAVKLV